MNRSNKVNLPLRRGILQTQNGPVRVFGSRISAKSKVLPDFRVDWKEIFFREQSIMRHLLLIAGLSIFIAAPASLLAQKAYDHGEVEAYGDLFRVAPTGGTTANYVGLGGLASFNTSPHWALEAQMTYDFEKSFTNTTSNGGSISTATARVRPISGLFGPKYQLGTSGPFRAFLEAKVGFVDFSTSCSGPAGSTSCFSSSLSNFGGANTHVAAFPGGGISAFWGPIGFRIDAGDQIYWNSGTYNNLRVTFGPALRF